MGVADVEMGLWHDKGGAEGDIASESHTFISPGGQPPIDIDLTVAMVFYGTVRQCDKAQPRARRLGCDQPSRRSNVPG